MEEKILAELRSIENQLSPENLHCDGEISLAEARAKGRKLEARKAELVKKLGYEPGFYDLYPEFRH